MNIEKMLNGNYIGMDQLMGILVEVSEYREKIEIIKKIKEYNQHLYKKETQRGLELKKIAKLQSIEDDKEQESLIKPIPATNDNKNSVVEEQRVEVSSYFHQLKECQTKEAMLKVLSQLEDKNNIRSIMLSFCEELALLSNLRYDKDSHYTEEELDYIDEEISMIKEQFDVIKEFISPNPKEKRKIKAREDLPTIVYLKTESGNACALSDAKDIPREYYESFNELFDSILDGEFKRHKFLSNNNAFIDGLQEVKNFKTRIIYKNIAANTYVILGMFIKKSNYDKGSAEFMKQRSSLYVKMEKDLLETLGNSDIVQSEQSITDEIKKTFGYSKREIGEKYGTVIK